MKNFIKHLWLRRWFRWCVWIAIIVFVTLVFVREAAGWAGTRRWVAVQEMLAREGESLDLHKIGPDSVPDDRNFCAIPALKDLPLIPADADDKSEQGRQRLRLVNAGLPVVLAEASPPKFLQGASVGMATDLMAWANWLHKKGLPPVSNNPAMDILAALSKNDSLVSELATGLGRPESQWTPALKTRPLPEFLFSMGFPHYTVVQKLTPMLCLRSAAAARVGEAAKAHESLLIALRLNEANTKEPFLIGTLVACGCSAIISSAVWELCDAHSGTAEDFQKLQEALSRFDYRKSFMYAEEGELAGSVNAGEYFKRTRGAGILNLADHSKYVPGPLIFRLLPDGWFDANTATIAQWHFDYCIKPLRDVGFTELLAKQEEMEALITEYKSQPYRHLDEFLALIAVPAFRGVTYRVVYTQCLVNEAIAACALERYRIEHGAYPDTLEAANIVGEKSIPLDVISGKPMGYRKTADGRYALWCVGFDGKDDGGKRGYDEKHPEGPKFYQPTYVGDWVWDFASK